MRLSLFLALSLVLATWPAAARDTCYSGTLTFKPGAVMSFYAGGIEYSADSPSMLNPGPDAVYDLSLRLRPDSKTAAMSLHRRSDDTNILIRYTKPMKAYSQEQPLGRSLPLSALFPDRDDVEFRKACDTCLGVTLEQADGASEFNFKLLGFDFDSPLRMSYGNMDVFEKGAPELADDYAVTYCDTGEGYFRYELESCSTQNALCRVVNKKRNREAVLQVSEQTVAGLKAKFSPTVGSASYRTDVGSLFLESLLFNRPFVSDRADLGKALEQLAGR